MESGQERGARKKRLGITGYVRAMVIARTAAVSWPEAKEMARRSDEPLSGPTDIPTESERRREER
jgi:hypothetical protein